MGIKYHFTPSQIITRDEGHPNNWKLILNIDHLNQLRVEVHGV